MKADHWRKIAKLPTSDLQSSRPDLNGRPGRWQRPALPTELLLQLWDLLLPTAHPTSRLPPRGDAPFPMRIVSNRQTVGCSYCSEPGPPDLRAVRLAGHLARAPLWRNRSRNYSAKSLAGSHGFGMPLAKTSAP